MIRLKRLYAHDFKQLREIDLHFPEAGRILVQGKNEAGKSTLFEAIFFALFGQALATESVGRPNLDDLIGYEKNKARVELDLAVRDRFFRITRTLNRGKPNVWELEIAKGDQLEEIKGNRPVNDRLVAELGFDAEALLNTCFVEQKKLEKLEGLNKTKREESLSKLLNLERLLDLEEKLRLRSEDEKMLTRLARRVELAEAQQQLPAAEDDLTKTEGQLKLIELRAQAARALEEKRIVTELCDQLQQMDTRREELKIAVGNVDALDRGRRAMANALDRFDLLTQQITGLDAMRQEQDETESAARDHLPALERRARELARLARNFERLNKIEATHATAAEELIRLQAVQQDLTANRERGSELDEAIAQHQARALEFDAHLHNYDVGEALGEWGTVAGEVSSKARGGTTLEEKERSRERAATRLRIGLIAESTIAVALVVATILIPLAISYLVRNTLLAIGFGIGLILVDASIAAVLVRRALRLWQDLERAAAELGKAQGESAARLELAASSNERMVSAGERLKEMGVAIPLSPEAAQSRRIEIAETLENKTREELNSERDAARARLNYARAQQDEVLRQTAELQAAASSGDLGRCQQIVAKAERIANFLRPLLAGRALELNVGPEMQAVRDARQETESQRRAWQTRIQQAAKVGAQIREGELRAKRISDELRTAYELAQALLGGRPAPWTPQLGRADYAAVASALSEAFESHGGEQVHAMLNSVEKEIGACERELKLRDSAGEGAVASARAILSELRIDDTLSAQASIAELADLADRFKKLQFEDKYKLEVRVRSMQMRVGALRHTRELLERELGLQGEAIVLQDVREELEKERRQQEERAHGAEIVLRARKRIVQKVLPATMDYMRRILPQLTRDRYHDAELDPESYKIRVWDERAGVSGSWKEKNIFSGGTKDQFSLALRLAFALATLPQERGTSPGFIFLDEPLGSFDDERAAALLYLLTQGEIAHAFDQIFLVSHVRVQEDLFTHNIRLESGAVVESTLEIA